MAMMAMAAGGVLQIPVVVYLLCKSNRMTPSGLILDISLCANVVHVTNAATAIQRQAQDSEEEANEPGPQPRRSNRARAPNLRVTGEDWTTA